MYKSKAIQCAFVILLSLIPLFALGQTNRGRISGQVTDSSGAVIPGAKITIENSGTHVQRVLETNAEGSYTAPDLDPGSTRSRRKRKISKLWFVRTSSSKWPMI